MMKEIKAKGVKITTLDPVEEKRWFKAFQEETRKWVAALEKKGKPAKEAVIMYGQIVEAQGSTCPAVPPEWHKSKK